VSGADSQTLPAADAHQLICTELAKTSSYIPSRCPHSFLLWDANRRRPFRKPCGRPKCSRECRDYWARKISRCLIRSFESLPPTHTIRLTSFAMLLNRELTKRVTRFLKLLRYRVPCAYLLVNEWSDGHRHMHILLRAESDISSGLVSELWAKVIGGPKVPNSTYCRPVTNPAGIARYIVKHIKDAGKKEVAPKSFKGRVLTYSQGFLSKSMETLSRELAAEWQHGRGQRGNGQILRLPVRDG
jgi:hypothetical protein